MLHAHELRKGPLALEGVETDESSRVNEGEQGKSGPSKCEFPVLCYGLKRCEALSLLCIHDLFEQTIKLIFWSRRNVTEDDTQCGIVVVWNTKLLDVGR